MEPIMYLSVSSDSPFLCHYGMPRRSGRYKWGSGDRPYQSMEGQGLTRREKRQVAKAEKEARKKAVADATAERQKLIYEQERARVLESGGHSATMALKYASSYNNKELQDIVTRVRLTKELEKLSAEERITLTKKVDKVMNGINKASDYGETIVKAARTTKRLFDLISGEESSKKDPQQKKKKES